MLANALRDLIPPLGELRVGDDLVAASATGNGPIAAFLAVLGEQGVDVKLYDYVEHAGLCDDGRLAAQRPADFSRRLDMPIIAELLQRLPDNPAIAFICGSNPFVEGAAQGLIDAGLPAPLIRTERYGV